MTSNSLQVRQTLFPEPMERLSPGVVAFDLEMANSFTGQAPVIAMIGLEYHDAAQGGCVSSIGTITRREDEALLIGWFLDFLAGHRQQYPDCSLLSFSGSDNDLPWIRARMASQDIMAPEQSILAQIPHLDLKLAFYQRTFNVHVSLKSLETMFGIHRHSEVESRKVSYILTDVLKGKGSQREIPDKIFQYLQEDVHNLLVIRNRWEDVSLEAHRLGDDAYEEQVTSLLRTAKKMAQALEGGRARRQDMEQLQAFLSALAKALAAAQRVGTFKDFVLPPLPPVRFAHNDWERVGKKHQRLLGIRLVDDQGNYQLKPNLNLPKGALAVVMNEGKLLMIRRAEHLKRAGGMWGLPGGLMEQGEIPQESAVRELKEELGLEGQAGRLLGASMSHTGEYRLYWVEVNLNNHTQPVPQDVEVAEARWVAPAEVSGLVPLIQGIPEQLGRILGPPWRVKS